MYNFRTTTSSNELLWNHAIENEDYTAARVIEVKADKIESLSEGNDRPLRQAISSRSANRILAIARQDNAEYAKARSADLLDAAEAAGKSAFPVQ